MTPAPSFLALERVERLLQDVVGVGTLSAGNETHATRRLFIFIKKIPHFLQI
jgi:hypothetical protein